jgi:hypothetical protein
VHLNKQVYILRMMCALISVVVILVLVYHLGIALGALLQIYKVAKPLLLFSLLLWIRTGVIIFLLIADNKSMRHLGYILVGPIFCGVEHLTSV